MKPRTASSTSASRPCSRRMLNIDCAKTLRGVLGLAGRPIASVSCASRSAALEVAVELRARAAEDRRPPQVERPVQRLGEPRGGGDLDVGARDVAELEQVHDGPARALELELGVAGRGRRSGAARPPPRAARGPSPAATARSGARRGRWRASAGRRAGGRAPPPPRRAPAAARVARVVELERQPREQPRPQRAVLVAERGQRLLEQARDLLVDAPELRPAARRSRARRGPSSAGSPSARAVAAAACEAWPARVLDPARSCEVAEREQQLAAQPVVRRAGQLARAQRRAVVVRRLLPGEQPVRAPRRRRARSRPPARAAPAGAACAKWCASWADAGRGRRRAARSSASPTGRAAARGAARESAVVERRADERVRERVAADAPGSSRSTRALDRLLQRATSASSSSGRDRARARRSRTRARSPTATASASRAGRAEPRAAGAPVTSRTPSGTPASVQRRRAAQLAGRSSAGGARPPR